MQSPNNAQTPVVKTDLFLTSFIGMHEMLRAAVSTRAARDEVSIGKNTSYQWANVLRRLDSMLDQAKSSISAVQRASKEGHRELPAEKGGSDACNAATCMNDFIDNYILISSAVATRAEADSDAYGPASEAYWHGVRAKLGVMQKQASDAILPMTRAADIEMLAEPKPKLVQGAPAESAEPQAPRFLDNEVHGVGANEYTVMLTLDTTAYREVKVKADDVAHARRIAQAVALEQQGAHFEMNEGNWVYPEQIHSNAVYDLKGVELWSDGPVNPEVTPEDLDKLDEAPPTQSM